MNTTVAADLRTDSGKGVARKLRAAGRIPAVMYGTDGKAQPLTVDPTALLEVFRKTRNRNTVINLQLGAETIPTLVKDAQRHPLSREVLHVDFYRVEAGRQLDVKIPVRITGRPAGASIGGRAEIVRRTLDVRCEYDKIPECIEIDVTPLEVGQTVTVGSVPAPEGSQLVFDRDFVVVICAGKKK